MAVIQNSTVYNILPPSYQNLRTECVAYALGQAIGRLYTALDGISALYDIDNADEDMLDYIAAELGIFFYDQSDTVARKRAAIKLGLDFYYHTSSTEDGFEDVMEFVYGECEVVNLGETDGEKIGVFSLDVGEAPFESKSAFRKFVSIFTRAKRAGSRCVLNMYPPDEGVTLQMLSNELQAAIAKIPVLAAKMGVD